MYRCVAGTSTGLFLADESYRMFKIWEDKKFKSVAGRNSGEAAPLAQLQCVMVPT